MKKKIGTWVEDFKEIIEQGYYFVDKTLFIKDIVNTRSKARLITRPSRFGKTVNLSMLRYYFEKSDADNSHLFDGLAISGEDEIYKKYKGKYPVISLSLKNMNQGEFDKSFDEFKKIIAREFYRHKRIFESDKLSDYDKKRFLNICNCSGEDFDYYSVIKFLSDCLYHVYQTKVIILIDDYDAPLKNAYFNGFYKKMLSLLCSVYESALKTNSSLEFGVLTGCLQIPNESIISGLNNLCVYTVSDNLYSEYFGFTEREVKEILGYFNLASRFDEVKEFYLGYNFDKNEFYNSYSILKYVQEKSCNIYWSDTSSHEIFNNFIENSNYSTRCDIERFMQGLSLYEPFHDNITYNDIDSFRTLSMLVALGYLKFNRTDDENYTEFKIPNQEIKKVYERAIKECFNKKLSNTSRVDLLQAIFDGDCEKFDNILHNWLSDTVVCYCVNEMYYHDFVIGLLSGYNVNLDCENSIVISENEKTVVIKIAIAEKFAELEKMCDEALKQIADRQFDIKYGVAFCDRSFRIKKA